MIWKAETLTALGFTGKLYYIILLPLGLSVAAFLFGVLQSYATYTGKQFGGTLTLSGPVVIFLLVVVLGFVLVPDHGTFPLTVFPRDTSHPGDHLPKNSGMIFVDLGVDPRSNPIEEEGRAFFPAIPAAFHGQPRRVWIQSDRYESVDPDKKLKLGEESIELPVRRKAGRIYGRVDTRDESCLSGVQVRVDGQPVDASTGHFEVTISGERVDDQHFLVASAPGCVANPPVLEVYVNANATTITLLPDPSVKPKRKGRSP